jgi:hypothetical protein
MAISLTGLDRSWLRTQAFRAMTVVLHRTLLAAMVVAGFGRALPRWDHTADVPAIASICEACCGAAASAGSGDAPVAAALAALPLAAPRVVIADSVAIAASSVVARPPLAVAPKTSPPVDQA